MEKRLPKFLEKSQVKTFVEFLPDKSLSQKRNKLIVRLLIMTGMRISELLGLKFKDLKKDRKIISVKGKNNKVREIPFGEECGKVIDELIKISSKSGSGEIINNLCGKTLSARYIQRIVRKYSSMLFGPENAITPHKLRHTFASMLRNNGAPIEIIQRILGHSRIETTVIYLHITGREERRYVEDVQQL
jgi:integrase/recombinase XerC